MTDDAFDVRDNPEMHRFEVRMGSAVAFAAYERDRGCIAFVHTVVPTELEGRGIGTALVRAGLAAAREQGLVVVPRCPFVAAYMRRHPETHDLLGPDCRV